MGTKLKRKNNVGCVYESMKNIEDLYFLLKKTSKSKGFVSSFVISDVLGKAIDLYTDDIAKQLNKQ